MGRIPVINGSIDNPLALKTEFLKFSPATMPNLLDMLARLLGLAFAVAVIILLAQWLTRLTAPRPVALMVEAAPVATSDNSARSIAKLFGAGESKSEAFAGLRLTGVFAGSRGGGFATFHSRSGEQSAFPGDEVSPGVRLTKILGDRVILSSADGQKELTLRDTITPTGRAPRRAAANQQAEDQ